MDIMKDATITRTEQPNGDVVLTVTVPLSPAVMERFTDQEIADLAIGQFARVVHTLVPRT